MTNDDLNKGYDKMVDLNSAIKYIGEHIKRHPTAHDIQDWVKLKAKLIQDQQRIEESIFLNEIEDRHIKSYRENLIKDLIRRGVKWRQIGKESLKE